MSQPVGLGVPLSSNNRANINTPLGGTGGDHLAGVVSLNGLIGNLAVVGSSSVSSTVIADGQIQISTAGLPQVVGAITSGAISANGPITAPSATLTGALNSATVSAANSISTPALTNGSLGTTAPQPLFGVSGNQVWTAGQATMVIAGWRIIWGTTSSNGAGLAGVDFVVPFAPGVMPIVIPAVMPSSGSPNYIMVAANGSGFGASPTNTTAQFKVLTSGGGSNPSSVCFVAFGQA